jgi:hypothetical protein
LSRFSAADYFLEFGAGATLFYWGVAPSSFRTYSGGAVSTGVWHHVVASKSGASTGDLYIDGVLKTNYTGTLVAVPSASAPLSFGVYYGNANPLSGRIDDLRIYSRALSSNEVSIIYNLYKP